MVFDLTRGRGGRARAAQVPALCELLSIPCAGPDALACAACGDLDLARRLARDAGVPVPRGMVLGAPRGEYDGDYSEFAPLLDDAGLTLPVLVTPAFGGPGVVARAVGDFGPAVVGVWRAHGQPALVEEFTAADELTAFVVGDDPPEVFAPSRVVEELALIVADALGLRDAAAVTFRPHDGVPHFVRADPRPDLHPESGALALAANGAGVGYDELVGKIVSGARLRTRG